MRVIFLGLNVILTKVFSLSLWIRETYDVIHATPLKTHLERACCGWLNFRAVPIFVVFMEGTIHELQFPRISDFLHELWRKILWSRILNPMNVSFSLNQRKLVPTKIKPSTVCSTCWDQSFSRTYFPTNCAPLLADIFLYSFEAEFIQSLL